MMSLQTDSSPTIKILTSLSLGDLPDLTDKAMRDFFCEDTECRNAEDLDAKELRTFG